MTSADRDNVLRAKLLADFLFFIRWFHKSQSGGQRFIVKPFHVELAEALVAVARGETTRLIINIPPRYGKTLIVVKMFVSWTLANNPRAKFIHLSYSDELALDNSAEIRDIV